MKTLASPIFRIYLILAIIGVISACEKSQEQKDSEMTVDEAVAHLLSLPYEAVDADKDVKDYLSKHPLYVSVTTSPDRIDKMLPTLKTIDQKIVTEILLVLPAKFKNVEEYPNPLPAAIVNFPKVKVLRPEYDYGPITKLIPAVEYAMSKDPKAIVTTVDDDTAYTPGVFGQEVKYLVKHMLSGKKPIAVGSIGQASDFWRGDEASGVAKLMSKKGLFSNRCEANGECDVIEGFGAISYLAESVPVEELKRLSDEKNTSRFCKLGDDIVINYALAKHGVGRHKVSNAYTGRVIQFDFGRGADALHNQNNYQTAYPKCVLSIEAYEMKTNPSEFCSKKGEKSIQDCTCESDAKIIACLRAQPRKDIKQNPVVRDYLRDHPVIVSMTSSPDRVGKLPLVLQTVDLDLVSEIIVALPKKFKDKVEYPELPPELINFPKVRILRPETDLGPITKLLPAVEYAMHKDPKAIIVTIDDDTGYAIGDFGQLIERVILSVKPIAAGTFGQASGRWKIKSQKGIFSDKCETNGPCDVIEGFGAIAYLASSVPVKELIRLGQTSMKCKLGDDVVINYGLEAHGVERQKIRNEYAPGVIQYGYGYQEDALHVQNSYMSSYAECVENMEGRTVSQGAPSKYTISGEERAFIDKVGELVAANKVNACYSLESAAYFLVHLLPLYHVHPGLFCGVKGSRNATELKRILLERGYPETSFRMFDTEQDVLQWFAQSPKNLFLADTGYKDSGNREWEKTTPNYINFPHGVDEDAAYIDDKHLDPSVPSAEMTLLLTKYNEAAQGSLEKIRNYYHLDPNKKTIFYAGTIGQWEFSDSLAPAAVREQTLQQLVELKKHYNVIVRPHPLQSKEFMDGLRREFVVAPFLDFPSFNAIYDLSDVVIGSVSTATTTATRRPELPIVLLRPRVTWPGRPQTDMAKYAARYKGIVLGQETAIVVDDQQILLKDSLVHAVEHALQDTPENRQRIEARKRYFAYWFDCVDGYEEYRAWARTLEKVGINIAELKSIYATFPKYRDRPLCHF